MPAANAQPDQAQVSQFVEAVAGQGFSGREVVPAGFGVCGLLDDKVSVEDVGRYVQDTFHDQREDAGYYASLFGQYATYHLCPRHLGEYGPI